MAEIIFEKIRSGKEGRDEVVSKLFHDQKLRSHMYQTLKRMGANHTDCASIFNSSLIQFVKTVIKNKSIEIHGELNAYVIGVAKYIWHNQLRKNKKNRSEQLEEFHDPVLTTTPESLVLHQDKISLLHDILQKMGAKCKEVLLLWAHEYKMSDIAKMMDYKSAIMARQKKYNCFHKLVTYINDHPHIKEALR